jgi:plasmid stabilization system protein ParE
MIYTVTWTKSAQNALADIWNHAPDKQAVTDASNRIDRDLRLDAHRKGRALGNHRVWIDPPLVVAFTVDPGDCMVRVIQVRRTN